MPIGYTIKAPALVFIVVPIFLVASVITIILKGKKGEKVNIFRGLLIAIFTSYIAFLVGIALFPIDIYFQGSAYDNQISLFNYVPLKLILGQIFNIGKVPNYPVFMQIENLIRNLAKNLIFLAPLGFVLPILWKKYANLKSIVIISLTSALSIELLQFLEDCFNVAYHRITQINDVILNVAGAMLGYAIYLILSQAVEKYRDKKVKLVNE